MLLFDLLRSGNCVPARPVSLTSPTIIMTLRCVEAPLESLPLAVREPQINPGCSNEIRVAARLFDIARSQLWGYWVALKKKGSSKKWPSRPLGKRDCYLSSPGIQQPLTCKCFFRERFDPHFALTKNFHPVFIQFFFWGTRCIYCIYIYINIHIMYRHPFGVPLFLAAVSRPPTKCGRMRKFFPVLRMKGGAGGVGKLKLIMESLEEVLEDNGPRCRGVKAWVPNV